MSRRALFEILCALVLVLVGGAIQAISQNLRFQNSDSIVPVFVSLYGWTPFFWDLDRFGMLVPLLAVPFREPLHNLIFQQILRSAATLAAPLALARLLSPRAYWFPTGLLALATWLGFHSLPAFAVASFQPYPTAICLGAAGILLLERGGRGRRGAGAAATLLAVWVAPTVVVWSIPLAVARSLLADSGGSLRAILRERRSLILTSMGAIVVVQGLAALWPGISHPTRLELVSLADWWLGLTTFISRWSTVLSPELLTLDLLLAGLALGFYVLRRTESRKKVALLALAPILTALVEAAALSTIVWFHLWGLAERYVSVGILLLCLQPFLVLAGFTAARTSSFLWTTGRVAVLCSLVAIAGLLVRFGPPSAAGARRALDTQMNRSIADAVLAANEADCTHLLGEWWHVFPVAFAANTLRAESGVAAGPIWPLSGSSRMMREKWEPADWGAAHVCVLLNDAKWREMADYLELPISERGEPGIRPIFLDAAVGEPGSGARGRRL